MSRSAGPASSLTRSASHSRSSTTRTSARLPADSPTGRKSAPRKFSRRASIAATTSVRAGLALEAVGQRGDRVGRVPAQFSVVAWWQQEQRGGHADGERDRPTRQPLVDRARRRARGQHEGQQRGPLPGRDRLAEHTRERDRHAEQEHQRDGEPRVRRHQGAQRDEDRAVDAQPRVGDGAGLPVAGEVRQHHQREGPEEREQRRLRIARDGEAHARRPTARPPPRAPRAAAHRTRDRARESDRPPAVAGRPARQSSVGTEANRPLSSASVSCLAIHASAAVSRGRVACSCPTRR